VAAQRPAATLPRPGASPMLGGMKSLLLARWSEIRPLFEHALDLPVAERADWIRAATSDPVLREAVHALIAREDALEATEVLPLRPPEPATARDPALPARLGRYPVLRELGRGGMGVVYLAEQAQPRRQVAIKRLTAAADGATRARFRREAELLAQLSHPGIARVIEVDSDQDGQPLLVMEYVEGEPLMVAASHRDRGARLALLAAIADAVEHAHARGIVHRDLKPANILVTADGQPKVLDFGIGRALAGEGATLTETGMLLGTPAYMAPEQALGEARVDARADVWALGVIGYELMVDRLPLPVSGLTPLQALKVVAHDTPPPLSRLDARLRGDLEVLIGTALAREPASRYASAGAFADELRRYLAGEPIRTRPPGLLQRTRLLIRRHPAATAAAAISLLALLSGAGFAFRYALIADAERLQARAEARQQEALREHFAAVVSRAATQGPSLDREALLDLAADPALTAGDADPATRRALLLAIADALVVRNDTRRLGEVLARHADWMAGGSDLQWATYHKHRAVAALRQGDADTAVAAIDLADAAVLRAGLSQTLLAADLAGYRGQLARGRGDLAQALRWSTQAADIARAATGASALDRGVTLANHAVTLLLAGEAEAAVAAVDEAEALWAAGGLKNPAGAGSARSVRANALWLAGDPAAALAAFEAIDANRPAGDPIPARAARQLSSARLLAWLGRPDPARADAGATALCEAIGPDSADCRQARTAAAEAAYIAGDLASAATRLDALGAAPRPRQADTLAQLLALSRGDPTAAQALIDSLDALPAADRTNRRQQLRLLLIAAHRADSPELISRLLDAVQTALSTVGDSGLGFEAAWLRIQRARLEGAAADSADLQRLRGVGLGAWVG